MEDQNRTKLKRYARLDGVISLIKVTICILILLYIDCKPFPQFCNRDSYNLLQDILMGNIWLNIFSCFAFAVISKSAINKRNLIIFFACRGIIFFMKIFLIAIFWKNYNDFGSSLKDQTIGMIYLLFCEMLYETFTLCFCDWVYVFTPSLENLNLTESIYENPVSNRSFCSICFEDYEQGISIIKLKCNHIFHKLCLEHWVKEQIYCPICRDTIAIV